MSQSYANAVLPLQKGMGGLWIYDAENSCVLVCSEEAGICSQLYKEDVIEADGFFICPECGTLGQRMVELSDDLLKART